MKRIGEVACKLVANPIELVAAANEVPREFEGGDRSPSQGEDAENLSPIARFGGPARTVNEVPVFIAPRTGKRGWATRGKDGRSDLNKKDRANPASGASRDYGREGENASFSTLAFGGRLKLVVNNCEPGQSRPIGRAFAPRRSGSHLLIVNNGVPHYRISP